MSSRMESNSFPSCMHVSDAVVQGLQSQADMFVCLGKRAIKGKGDMVTHLYKVTLLPTVSKGLSGVPPPCSTAIPPLACHAPVCSRVQPAALHCQHLPFCGDAAQGKVPDGDQSHQGLATSWLGLAMYVCMYVCVCVCVCVQVGDWEAALVKYKASQEEGLALANAQAAALESRAMSLSEGEPNCSLTHLHE